MAAEARSEPVRAGGEPAGKPRSSRLHAARDGGGESSRAALEIAVAALCAIAFVSSGAIYLRVGSPDLHAAFLPKYQHAWQALSALRLPLWNPWESCGLPLLGVGQGALLYPPIVALFALLPAHAALLVFYLLHAFLLAFAVQRHLRLLGAPAIAAAVAAPIALAAAFRLLTVDHPSFLAAQAWFPVMLLCWERAARAAADTPAGARARRRWTAGFALAVAAQWLAGYPDFVFDSAALLGVAVLFAPAGERVRRLAILAVAFALGSAIAAVQIAAIVEALADSARVASAETFAGMRRMLLEIRGWTGLMTTPASVRTGAALALAAVALLEPTRRRLQWLLAFAWCVLPMNPPFAWLYLLPPFSLSRLPVAWAYLGAIYLGLLAAAGLATALAFRRPWMRAGGAALAAVAVAQSIAVLATPPLGLVPGVRLPEPVTDRRADRIAAVATSIEPHPRLLSGPETHAGNLLRRGLRSALGHEPSGGPPRWSFDLIRRIAPETRPRQWGDWPLLDTRSRDLASLLGVGLVVAKPRAAERLRAAGFAEVEELEGGDVLLAQPAVPRARIVHRVRRARDDADSLALTVAHAGDARHSAIVGPEADALVPVEPPPGARESLRIAIDDPERVAIEAELAAPGLLVLTDTWARGWSATIDGVPHPVWRVDHGFRGLPLAPGSHRVVFEYRPRLVVWSGWLSLVALAAALAMLASGRPGARRAAGG